MSKLAEWLIAILASILLGYLLIDRAGFPWWLAALVGLLILIVGAVIGREK